MLQKMAAHALTILVNLAADDDVLEILATDDKFLDLVLSKIIVRCTLYPG